MHSVALKNVIGLFISLHSFFILAMDNSVILLYHHVSKSTPSVTSVTPDMLKQHMHHLAQHYQCFALRDGYKQIY
jgi:hypothetical protein